MRGEHPQQPACTTEDGAVHRPSHIRRACRRRLPCPPHGNAHCQCASGAPIKGGPGIGRLLEDRIIGPVINPMLHHTRRCRQVMHKRAVLKVAYGVLQEKLGVATLLHITRPSLQDVAYQSIVSKSGVPLLPRVTTGGDNRESRSRGLQCCRFRRERTPLLLLGPPAGCQLTDRCQQSGLNLKDQHAEDSWRLS